MSRLDELKKQYPELNVTVLDFLQKMDPTNTYKYLPLLCKILGVSFNVKRYEGEEDYGSMTLEIKSRLLRCGLNLDKIDEKEMQMHLFFIEFMNINHLETIGEFIQMMEKNQILNKDLTSYSGFTEIQNALSLSKIKLCEKELRTQVYKEFENEAWLVIRPLTFESSSKYGASTRWCTTSSSNKEYFAKYWSNGILLYVINKITGNKFAIYKELVRSSELSFWNSEDNRVDSMDLNIDDFLYQKLKEILKSDKKNKDFCTDEIRSLVERECSYGEKIYEVRQEQIENYRFTTYFNEAEVPSTQELTQL